MLVELNERAWLAAGNTLPSRCRELSGLVKYLSCLYMTELKLPLDYQELLAEFVLESVAGVPKPRCM